MIFKFHRKNTLMTGKEEADIDASIAKTASAECAATDAPSNPATQPQADEVPGPPNRAIGSMDRISVRLAVVCFAGPAVVR